MRQSRHEIIRRDPLCRCGERAVDIALVAYDLAGLARRRFELGAINGAVETGVGAVIPFDLSCWRPCCADQVLSAITATPPNGLKPDGIGVAGISTTRSTPATESAALASKDFDSAAIDRATLDQGVFHAGHDDVDAIDRAAVDDVVEIDDRSAACRYSAIRCGP